ncbi:MAG: UDP-N-acetylmuramoyl-L-alanine--D-glutamate ligase [Desulfopila sp.]|jgi:UDP-N-acetylmuramoylalanine--D-glutamate ligase|nr:UDP-N-acetylmuramoyl-L-alanine--D-glutamate ligase [Desulfopila sp.]
MKNPMIRQGMPVVVLGLGVTGKAAVRYLHALGARVYVSDAKAEDSLSHDEKELLAECCEMYQGGAHAGEFIARGELIFVSPGIDHNLMELKAAREAGVEIVGELSLAAPLLSGKIVAVTGTNGKTTVTTLVGKLLEASGMNPFVCGNIGLPLLECLMRKTLPDVVVVEVSSFQLETVGSFRPDIAILLNITPDHLDRHGSFADYLLAKKNLFLNQGPEDKAIICADNVICRELADQLTNVDTVLFGHSKECHAYICDSQIYIKLDGVQEKYEISGTTFENPIGRTNCAAALLAAKICGCNHQAINGVLRSFKGLPHRMEMVDSINGVSYYNDSKATNTGAVISALRQTRGKVVLIAGGKDKGDDYSLLREVVRQKVKNLILIGEAAHLIAKQLDDIVTIEYAATMEEAVAKAVRLAECGDTVLLSPACASFDMFSSYGHRGRSFVEAVKNFRSSLLSEQAGA